MGKTMVAQPATRRAAIYVRVSTEAQEEGTSLATQERACCQFATEHGYTIAATFREVHTGAELAERPQLSRLREMVRAGEIDAVIAYAVDRLSREQAHLYILDDEAERAGAALLFVTEEFDKTPVGKIIRSVKAFAAELEREKIRERTVRGMHARVAAGNLTGRGRPIYGYRYADDSRTRLVPDPQTAPIIQELFALAEAGLPFRQIAQTLTARGIPSPRGHGAWGYTSIGMMLANPAYIGEAHTLWTQGKRERGKIRHIRKPASEHVVLPATTVPPLISRDLFTAVQERLQRNKAEAARSAKNPEIYLLRAGFARCGRCGRPLTACWQTRNRRGDRYAVYRAHGAIHQHCFPNQRGFSIRTAMLDQATWDTVQAYLLEPHRFTTLWQRREQHPDPAAERLASIDRALADIAKRQRNLTGAIAQIEDPIAREQPLAQLTELAQQQRALIAERESRLRQQQAWAAGQQRQEDLIDYWCNAAANLDRLDYAGKRDLLSLLGIEARCYPDGRYRIIAPDDPARSLVPARSECTGGAG